MMNYIKVAGYTALCCVAVGALIVGLVAGEPLDKLRFWLALSFVGLFVVSFIAGVVGAGVERMTQDEREAALRAEADAQFAAVQQQAAAQFEAGFDYANGLAARATDAVAKSWGVASKSMPRTSMPPMGAPAFGRLAELAEGNGHEPLEL